MKKSVKNNDAFARYDGYNTSFRTKFCNRTDKEKGCGKGRSHERLHLLHGKQEKE